MLAVSPGWLDDILLRAVSDSRLDELERKLAPDTLVRLIKSSGTTGVPKVMGMTQRVQQSVIRKLLTAAPDWVTGHVDYLCLYNFAVRASHSRAMLTLQRGGTIHLTAVEVLWNLLAAGIGNYVMFVVGDLERFVRTAPPNPGPFRLYLDVIGAAAPPRLRQQVRATLTEHLVITYSSNETNRISLVDDDNVGTLYPGVRIKIVDDQGAPVPLGQTGLIRVKTDTMTDGYRNAPDLNHAAFVNGWFQTNDVGFQPSKDKLVVLGRDDDMLNIGGLKIAPGPIEQCLKAINGVHDALVTSIDHSTETHAMLIAVEPDPGADLTALRLLITPMFQSQIGFFHLALLPVFPRTDTGKIRREAVKDLYRRQAQNL